MLLHQGGGKALDIGAPDERQHANYVSFVRAGKGFPILKPGTPDFYETYQSHQPPLYYILGAGWSVITGADPQSDGGGFLMRLLNTIIGCSGLVGVYWLARWARLGEGVALAATATAALLPMNVALHAAVSNDPLLFALCTWGLAFTVKGLHDQDSRIRYLAGLTLGVALWTKTTGIVLAPVLLVAAAIGWRHRVAGWYHWLGAICLGLLIASPWMARNQMLYGDPFAARAFTSAFTGNPMAKDFISDIGLGGYLSQMVAWWTSRSFIGVFGYMDIFVYERQSKVSALFYNLVWFVIGIVALGPLLAPKLGKPFKPKPPEAPYLTWVPALTLLLMVVGLFLRFNLQYFQAQARYVYPAISVFGLAIGFGAVAWAKEWGDWAWVGVAVFFGALDLIALSQLSEAFAIRLGQTVLQ